MYVNEGKVGGRYFKELAQVFVETSQVQNLQGRPIGWKPKKELQLKSEGSLLEEVPLFHGGVSFFLKIFYLLDEAYLHYKGHKVY